MSHCTHTPLAIHEEPLYCARCGIHLQIHGEDSPQPKEALISRLQNLSPLDLVASSTTLEAAIFEITRLRKVYPDLVQVCSEGRFYFLQMNINGLDYTDHTAVADIGKELLLTLQTLQAAIQTDVLDNT